MSMGKECRLKGAIFSAHRFTEKLSKASFIGQFCVRIHASFANLFMS